ncbi:MAG: hypothetical protein ABII97_00015 [Patescibacteria group bacterium]
MTTRFVGTKELRQNMAKITKEAELKNQRIIVLRKNKPIFELRPLSNASVFKESFIRDIEKAREDVRKGRVHSQAEVEKMLGL